jgi:hypothetical protein
MKTIQISGRRLQQLKARAKILKMTPERLLVWEQLKETARVLSED